jgi:hypothetical protein
MTSHLWLREQKKPFGNRNLTRVRRNLVVIGFAVIASMENIGYKHIIECIVIPFAFILGGMECSGIAIFLCGKLQNMVDYYE